ncbi:unnamed protein product [Dicrocoelium dendriticum]|nr:unnamed protein product [Dicrocoelium dendriticum]
MGSGRSGQPRGRRAGGSLFGGLGSAGLDPGEAGAGHVGGWRPSVGVCRRYGDEDGLASGGKHLTPAFHGEFRKRGADRGAASSRKRQLSGSGGRIPGLPG